MTNKKTKECEKCGKNITTNNIDRHTKTCQGIKRKKIRGVDYDPNIGFRNGTRVAWNKGLKKELDIRIANHAEKLKRTLQNMEPKGAAAWDTEKRREAAKRQRFGGYRPNAGRSKKFKVLDSFGREITLQSTFELECSKVLDEMGVRWVRPKALKYDGKNYFADFYLFDYNIWLDPKNNYKIKVDEEKIQKVLEQNDVKLFVLSEKQITKEYIACLLPLWPNG